MTTIARSVAGAAAATTITAPMTTGSPASGGGTFAVANGSGYPTANFVVVIDRGMSTEEKILCSSRSTNTFTVGTSGRGYDGTAAAAHSNGATLEHELDALVITALLEHVNTNAGDDHPALLNIARHDTTARHGSSVVSHGSIGGLGADDHTQYHNNTRGDLRYDLLGAAATAQAYAIARANHTGTQLAATISDLTAAINAVVGSSYQAKDSDLTAIAALASAADQLPYATGAQAWALTTLTSFARTLLDDTTAAAMRTTLGLALGTWTGVTFTNSWVNAGGSLQTGQYRTEGDLVRVRGVIKNGNSGQSAFTLPSNMRPPADLVLPALCGGNAIGRLDITSAGVFQPTGSNVFFNIDCAFSTAS